MFKKNPKIFLVIAALVLIFSFLIFANLRTGLQASVANAQESTGMLNTALNPGFILQEPLTVYEVFDFLNSQDLVERYENSSNPQSNFMSDSNTSRFLRESKALMNAFANLYTEQGTQQVQMQFKEYKVNADIQSNSLSQASSDSSSGSLNLFQ